MSAAPPVSGHLAQLEEHPLDVRKVSGSNPLMSTNFNPVRNDGVFAVYDKLTQFDNI